MSVCCQSCCQLSAIIYDWRGVNSNCKIVSALRFDCSLLAVGFGRVSGGEWIFHFAKLVHALDWRTCIWPSIILSSAFIGLKIMHFWINTFLMNVTLAVKNWTYTESGFFSLEFFFDTFFFLVLKTLLFSFSPCRDMGNLWEGQWRVDAGLFLYARGFIEEDSTGMNPIWH